MRLVKSVQTNNSTNADWSTCIQTGNITNVDWLSWSLLMRIAQSLIKLVTVPMLIAQTW